MFTKAIVRTPGESFENGLTQSNLGKPDYQLALKQHQNYISALEKCGLKVFVLPPDENFPDSVFVEDTALCTRNCAVITNPGADSRKGEVKNMQEILQEFYKNIEAIHSPGTIEAGDIMMTGNHFFIGLSERTNLNGAGQMEAILNLYGMTAETVKFENILHLKTGVSFLEGNNILCTKEFSNHRAFQNFNKIFVEDDETYSANSIWVNNKIIMPAGFPKTKAKIVNLNYEVIEVDVSEFQKMDGGVSCLSLRF